MTIDSSLNDVPPPLLPPFSPQSPTPDLERLGNVVGGGNLSRENAEVNGMDSQEGSAGGLIASLASIFTLLILIGLVLLRRRYKSRQIKKELLSQDLGVSGAETHAGGGLHSQAHHPRGRVFYDGDAATEDDGSTPRHERDVGVDQMLTPRSRRAFQVQNTPLSSSELQTALLSPKRRRSSKKGQPSVDARSDNSRQGDFDDLEGLDGLNSSDRRRLADVRLTTYTTGDDLNGDPASHSQEVSPTIEYGSSFQNDGDGGDDDNGDGGNDVNSDDDQGGTSEDASENGDSDDRCDNGSVGEYLGDYHPVARTSDRHSSSSTNVCPAPAPLPRPSRQSLGSRYPATTIVEETDEDRFSNFSAYSYSASTPSTPRSVGNGAGAILSSSTNNAKKSSERPSYSI